MIAAPNRTVERSALTLLGALMALASPVWAQDEAPAFPPKPGPEHAILAKDVGTWEATLKSYMNGPDVDPLISKGTEINRMVGDLWLVSDFKGDFAGLEFHGHGIYGYDQHKKAYVGSWADSMGTYILNLEGKYDPATKSLTYLTEGHDPNSGQDYRMKMVTKWDGDGRVFTISMALPKDAEFVKLMEATYTKAK